MSAAAPLWLLLIQERVTLIQQAPGAQNAADLTLPIGTATLRLHGDPPTPLQIEHAIESVEDVVMNVRAHLGAVARLATRDAALHALARHADAAGGWLGIDAVEQLFSRLAARAAGRPAAQDALLVDGASAARLVILRELLHHGALSGLQLID